MSLIIAQIRYKVVLEEFKNINNILNQINKFRKFTSDRFYNFKSTLLEFALFYFQHTTSYDFCNYFIILKSTYGINIYNEIEDLSLKNLIHSKLKRENDIFKKSSIVYMLNTFLKNTNANFKLEDYKITREDILAYKGSKIKDYYICFIKLFPELKQKYNRSVLEIYLETELEFEMEQINQLDAFQFLLNDYNVVVDYTVADVLINKILKIIDLNFKYNNFTIEDLLILKFPNELYNIRKKLLLLNFNINLRNYYNGDIYKTELPEERNECYILLEPIKQNQMFYLCVNKHPVDKFEFDDFMVNQYKIPSCGICRDEVIISHVYII